MADFTMRPHTFVVSRNDGAGNVPPTENWVVITSGSCNNQSGASGNIGNENEAMDYDYVNFYDIGIVEEIKVEDKIVVTYTGTPKIIEGTVKKWLPGQLSNRIWHNEISK